MRTMKANLVRGFTLIEMLVVVLIISVLAVLGLSSYRSANRNARDARRKADLEQVRSALEMYRTDKGYYPGGDTAVNCSNMNNWNGLAGELAPASGTKYMESLPKDPDNSQTYDYQCLNNGQSYMLCADLENDPTPSSCTTSGMTGDYGVSAPL